MKTNIALALSLSVIAVAASALAAVSMSPGYLAIVNLDATPEGTRMWERSNVTFNPHGCSEVRFYEPASGISIEQREALDRTLLSAFLAGRKVRLGVDTANCGANNAPAYHTVRLDVAE
jgi:hypothetical protein